jgi:O-antigen ligase
VRRSPSGEGERPLTIGFYLALAAIAGLAVLSWFVQLERRGNRMATVTIILGLLVLESVLYPDESLAPAGLFHPGVGGTATNPGLSFRLPDLLIPTALAARALGRGRVLRLVPGSLWWIAFMVWIWAEAVVGIQNGNSSALVTFEAKAIVYVGFFLLVAGVPAVEFATGRPFRRLLELSAVLATATILLDQAKARFAVSLPLARNMEIGLMGADAATIFFSLGLIAFAIAMCSEHGRTRLLLTAVPLLTATFASGQRAALVALVAGLLSLAIGLAFRWRRVRTTGTEFILGFMVVVSLFLTPVIYTAVVKTKPVVPFARQVEESFTSQGKQLSAEDRLNQWTSVRSIISAHPWMGNGLGTTYQHFDPGKKIFVITDLTHNVMLDLLLRMGIIGVVLFLFPVFLTFRDAARVWWYEVDARIAAFALASACAIIGVLAKGMVESIFEKFRLATLLGFLLGAVTTSTLSAMAREPESAPIPDGRARAAWS